MKRIFVSDVHMGAGRSFRDGYKGCVYDWLNKDEAVAFADFLGYVNRNPEIEEIILLGDIMDDWVCPVDAQTPTLQEIIIADINREIVRGLKILSANKKTIYIPGNHDMSVTRNFIETNFPGMFYLNKYFQDGIYAAHGSEYGLFCAPDPMNDPSEHLPIGYYISRVAATTAAKTGRESNFRDYLRALIEEIGKSQTVVDAVFEAVADEAHLNDDTPILIGPSLVDVKAVKERYADLFAQWEASGNMVNAREALIAEINGLSSVPFTLSTQKEYDIVIFGHTHEAFLGKLPLYNAAEETYVYANTGTWCDHDGKGRPFTFIETEKNEPEGKHYVRLKTWDLERKQPADEFQEAVIEAS
jgi:UDP-2,3-diacylglucosamine pyrophosphatase LpxH